MAAARAQIVVAFGRFKADIGHQPGNQGAVDLFVARFFGLADVGAGVQPPQRLPRVQLAGYALSRSDAAPTKRLDGSAHPLATSTTKAKRHAPRATITLSARCGGPCNPPALNAYGALLPLP